MRRAGLGLLAALALSLAGCAGSGGFESPTGCDLQPRGRLAVTLSGDVPLVTGTIDGKPVTLILDTGAERTLLTDGAVARLDLPRDPVQSDRVVGFGASAAQADADARSFRLGDIALRNRPIMVGAYSFYAARAVVPDGLLGLDVLSQYDIDLNLPANEAVLYRARICPDQPPPWRVEATELPAMRGPHEHLRVPVTVDGMDLQATVDSGAQTSAVATAAARRLGLGPAALAADPMLRVTGLSPVATRAHVHRFARLQIGGLLFLRPFIPVTPLPDYLGEALIGADILRLHRVWLSWASQRAWIAAER